MTSAMQTAGSKIEAHVWRIAAVVVLGTIMSVLDTTIVNVALDTLGRDLNASVDQIQWVVTGYLLALAAVIPVSGWASRRFSGRSVYLFALVLFTAGSVLCGLADSTESLIAFRVIQGIGGGMLVPTGQMILVRAAGPQNLAKVMSVIGVPIVLAPIFGPTLGGLLLEHVSWQSIFLVNLPVGILTLVAALKLLPKDQPEGAEPLDFLGLGILSVGLVGITYGLAEVGSAGTLIAGSVLIPLVIGLVGVAAFVWRSLHIPNPLLNVRLYLDRAFTAASITTFALGAALFGAMVLMPLYFQTVRGEDAVTTGLLLIPQGLGAAVAMALSGRSTERLGAGMTAVIGSLITLVATVPFVMLGANTSFVLIAAAMVVRGFGIGMSIMPAMTAAYGVLTPDQVTHATPQLTTLQRVGGSIGTAVLTVVLQSHLETAGTSQAAMASAFGDTFIWVMGITVVALLPTLVLAGIERRGLRRPAEPVPAPAPAPAETEAREPAPVPVLAEAETRELALESA
ncbi:MAG TPA: DHA2 family efflux MFS transporter permease subunit [Solirubrobacterales bacterium]|nr:DHA2 family efflux MFS transporter permease subunit [Solirubrobacterales bacterium]